MAVVQQYIGQATFVASFAVDRGIRFRVADIERSFQSIFTAQAISTNVPDSGPASIPRFTMQSGPKQISVSQISAQLDLNFAEQRKSVSNTFAIIEKNFLAFWEGICQLKRLDEIKHAGLVLTINTPSTKSRQEVCAEILQLYAKVPARGIPASASIQFGFLDVHTNLYTNVSMQHYEVRSGALPMGIQGAQFIDVDVTLLPVTEQGFETKVDINSRPMEVAQVATPKDLGPILLVEMKTFVTGWGKEFISWD